MAFWTPIKGEIVLRSRLFFDFLLNLLSLPSLDASYCWFLGDVTKLFEITACFLEWSVSESNVYISFAMKLETVRFKKIVRFLPPSESSLKGSNSFLANIEVCLMCSTPFFLIFCTNSQVNQSFSFPYYRHTILYVRFCDIKFVFRSHRQESPIIPFQ